jgi:hypothetical protein
MSSSPPPSPTVRDPMCSRKATKESEQTPGRGSGQVHRRPYQKTLMMFVLLFPSRSQKGQRRPPTFVSQLNFFIMPAKPDEYQINVSFAHDPKHRFEVFIEKAASVGELKIAMREVRPRTLGAGVVEDFEIWKVRYQDYHKR